MIRISSELSNEEFAELEGALKRNANIFIWSTNDMLRVYLEKITHKLNVNLTYHPMKQKRKNFISDHSQAIDEEVTKFLEACFIHEVPYP